MKVNNRIIILTIIIGLTTISCQQATDKINYNLSESPTKSKAKDTLSIATITDIPQKLNFDVERFVELTDSLLTSIQGKPIGLTTKIDTIRAEKIDGKSFYSSLFTAENSLVKRYSFDPGKSSKELRFWFLEAKYQDINSTNKVFEELHRISGTVDSENDYLPGLTYTNDYVIKSSNKIYWLNTGCPYSFSNHQKISQFILQSLPSVNIKDSIWCKCGQPKCSL